MIWKYLSIKAVCDIPYNITKHYKAAYNTVHVATYNMTEHCKEVYIFYLIIYKSNYILPQLVYFYINKNYLVFSVFLFYSLLYLKYSNKLIPFYFVYILNVYYFADQTLNFNHLNKRSIYIFKDVKVFNYFFYLLSI